MLAAALLAACADGPVKLDTLFPWWYEHERPPREARDAPAPAPKLPPGALNDAVTQANIKRTICSNGWSASLRPPASFLLETKTQLMKEAGIPATEAAKYEVDFLIPIGLGGHPRKPENLWLQPVDGPWGARTKDRLEAKLRHLVCSGEITLFEARDAMRTDWKMAARYYLSDRELLAPID